MKSFLIKNMPDDLHKALSHMKVDTGISMEELIIQAIRDMVCKESQ